MVTDLKDDITARIIEPNIRNEFAENYTWKKRWKKIGCGSEAFAEICVGVNTLISFAATYWTNHTYLSFVAGCFGVVAIAARRYAASAYKNHAESVNDIITLSHRLDIRQEYIPPMPRVRHPSGVLVSRISQASDNIRVSSPIPEEIELVEIHSGIEEIEIDPISDDDEPSIASIRNSKEPTPEPSLVSRSRSDSGSDQEYADFTLDI